MSLRRIGLALVVATACLAPPSWATSSEKVVRLKLGPFRIEPNRDREVCQALKVPGVAGNYDPDGKELASTGTQSKP